MTDPDLSGLVIAVPGAGGPAGVATVRRLAAGGATVLASDAHADRLTDAVAAAEPAPGVVHGSVVNLLDWKATEAWAKTAVAEHGRVDGLVHLVGGWRGSKTFGETRLEDWDLLDNLLIRTLQHTTLALHDALLHSPRGRLVIVSAAGASKPTEGNAAYAAAKAAAEAWVLAAADSYAKERAASGTPDEDGPAAAILVVKALVNPHQRAAEPDRSFAGYTDVAELADVIAGLWDRSTAELNGQHLWLTP